MGKDYQLRHKFDLTLQEYEDLLEEQNHECAICYKPDPTNRKLAVDHDHKTKVIRGLLCGSCNNGLGRFQDDPEILERAAKYLRRFEAAATKATVDAKDLLEEMMKL